jgi:hypothetical protein
MKKLLVGMFLLSAPPFALACEKIDYVEVKDWPVDKVEKALCEAMAESLGLTMRSIDLTDVRTGRSPYDAAMNLCDAQASLYGRVLENVHKRKVPPLASLSVKEACKNFPDVPAKAFPSKAKP